MTAIVRVFIRGSTELAPDEISIAEVEFDTDSLEYELLQRLDLDGIEILLLAYMSRNGYTTLNPALGEYVSSVTLDDQLLGEPTFERRDQWEARVQSRIDAAIRVLNSEPTAP